MQASNVVIEQGLDALLDGVPAEILDASRYQRRPPDGDLLIVTEYCVVFFLVAEDLSVSPLDRKIDAGRQISGDLLHKSRFFRFVRC